MSQINNPKITVVTVTYNCANVLQATIDSVVSQDYANVEYIIIDGASTDGTLDIIKANSDRITRWVSEPDTGIYDAMNKGIALATGDYIYFLGGDDVIYNCEIFSSVAKYLKQDNRVYYGNVLLTSNSERYRGRFNRLILSYANICHQAMFFPVSVFKSFSFEVRYPLFADHYMNMQISHSKTFRFVYMPFVICLYNDTGASSNFEKDPLFFEEFKVNSITLLGRDAYLVRQIVMLLVKVKKQLFERWT